MTLPIFQVDAFADEVFSGNPAAVMPLQTWLDDSLLQAMAMENNLSETAYMVQVAEGYELRWFTPQVEVDLCGHATLAAAHVLFEHLDYSGDEIPFHTRSGMLRVNRSGAILRWTFPAARLVSIDVDLAVCKPWVLPPAKRWHLREIGCRVVCVRVRGGCCESHAGLCGAVVSQFEQCNRFRAGG